MQPQIGAQFRPFMNLESLKSAVHEERQKQRSNIYAVVEALDYQEQEEEAFLTLRDVKDFQGKSVDVNEGLESSSASCESTGWQGRILSVDPASRTVCVKVEKTGPLRAGDRIAIRPYDFLGKLYEWAINLQSSSQSRDIHPLGGIPLENIHGLQAPSAGTLSVGGSLRPSQELAVRRAGSSLLLLWGPPGTGKTHVLGQIIAEHWSKGRTVCALSISHVAVDQLAMAVDRAMQERSWQPEPGVVVRFGQRTKRVVADLPEHLTLNTPEIRLWKYELVQLRNRLNELNWYLLDTGPNDENRNATLSELGKVNHQIKNIDQKVRNAQLEMVNNAKVVLSTFHSYITNQTLHDRPYDVTVIDEASMVPIAFVARIAADRRSHLVFAGDFMQLGPICQGTKPRAKIWFENSVFELLGADIKSGRMELEKAGVLSVLEEQSRMHPKICQFISKTFYDGRLSTVGEHVFEPELVGWPTDPVLIDDPVHYQAANATDAPTKQGGSWRWDRSAQCICNRVARAFHLTSDIKIAVVTPFNQQAQLLKTLLGKYASERLIVGTVHRMQGQEADIVFFDLVNLKSGFLNGSTATRLINVAISRAKKQVVIVAPYHDIACHPILAGVIQYAQKPNQGMLPN